MSRPPGAVLLAIGYGAGLATGLARFPDPVLLVAVLLAVGWLMREEWWCAILVAMAIGIPVGRGVQFSARRSCSATLPLGEAILRLRLVEPGRDAGRVTPLAAGCRGDLMARWPTGADLPAGAEVVVRARWLPTPGPLGRPDGQLLVRRVESASGTGGPIDRMRTAMARATRLLYGPRAPLVDALVTGRRGALAPDLRQAFAAAGLVHLLAISGFHIGLVAGWILLALRIGRCPRHPAEALASLAALGYAAFLGWPAPATRAGALLALAAWLRWRQRHAQPGALLGASAVVVECIDPWSVFEPGAWLSILALAGLIAATRWSDRAINRAALTRSISGSIGATILTAPVTSLVFGRVAVVGVVLNLAAVPLAALAIPALLASLLMFPILPALSHAFATSGALLLAALEALARLGARAPGFGDRTGGLSAAWPWALAALAGCYVVAGRSTRQEAGRRALWCATLAAWLALLVAPIDPDAIAGADLTLFFLDVGQGDAAVLRTPGGHWIVVDAGPADDRGDAGRRVVVPFLRRQGAARVDAFVLSHAHRDHVGGATSIEDALPVGVAIDPGERFPEATYERWLEALPMHGTRWHPAHAGEQWTMDGVTFTVLHPPMRWEHQGEDLNEDSLVLEVRYREFAALLMGDAGLVAEGAMGRALPHVDLLKVGHHGSRGASGTPFLSVVHPEAAVISVGKNTYGHPAREALARLAQAGVTVWRTDREGTVRVRTDGRQVSVSGGRTAVTFEATAGSAPEE